jgi:hypothetical protein
MCPNRCLPPLESSLEIILDKSISRSRFRWVLSPWTAPVGENSNQTTTSDPKEKRTQTEARDLYQILPCSNIGVHSLGIYHEEDRDHARRSECCPIHLAAKVFRLALPRCVPDCCSYQWDNCRESEQKQSCFKPYASIRVHCSGSITDAILRIKDRTISPASARTPNRTSQVLLISH